MRTSPHRASHRGGSGILACTIAVWVLACGGRDGDLELGAEYPQADEAATTQRLIELTKEALKQRHASGKTRRFNQSKHVGCVRARFEVAPDLAADLRVGLFDVARAYPTWIRFANASTQSDTEKDFRGMSLKLMGVEKEMLLGGGANLDFILNSHPVLFVGRLKDFTKFVETSLNSKPVLFFLNPFDLHIKELLIVRAGRQHHPSHLAIPYWSTTPYLFGAGKAVKYAAKPCAPSSAQLPDELTDEYLRDAMREQLAGGDACFEFMVQLQTDAEAMPVEDATVEWDEAASPFRKVATVRIPSQSFDSPAQMEFCENLAFNPWQSLAEHRPLGGLNRARKDLYTELARFRHERNQVSYSEPTGDETF